MVDTPNNLVLGMVAKKINALMDGGLSFDKAFEQFKNTASEGYKKYNLDTCKAAVQAKVNQKRACEGCVPKEESKKPESKKPESKKEKGKKKETDVPAPAAVPIAAPAPAVVAPPVIDSAKKGFAMPIAMKAEGRVDFVDHPNGGKVLKKTDKSKKLAVLCGDGTHGKVLDDDTIGCEFD